jgi:hypothetical protein
MKKIILTIFLFGSISLFSQELFVDYLEKVPLKQHLDYVFISKVFNIDTLWKREMGTRFCFESKFIDKSQNVNTVILCEETGVGSKSYLYSLTNEGKIIDNKKISEGSDNADLMGPDFDSFYSLENMKVTIDHRLSIPVQPTKEETHKTHINENYYTYIQICKHGYFFELTEKNPSKGNRLFPYTTNELVPIELLKRLTKDDLTIMRNEIFASHGYRFKDEKLIAYFNEQEWYEAKLENVDDKLTPQERDNIILIKSIEDNY